MNSLRIALNVVINLALLPLYVLFFAVSFFVTFLPVFPSRVGVDNLKKHLPCGTFAAHVLMARVYFNYACYLIEIFLLFPLGLTHTYNIDTLAQGIATLRRDYDVPDSTGVLFLGAHLGNIEETGRGIATAIDRVMQKRFVCLAKPAPLVAITRFFHWLRGIYNIDIIWTDRKDLVRALIATAKKGNSLGYLIDQKPDGRGLFAEFFGELSAFPLAGIEPPLRQGMPVMHIVLRRIWPGYFEFIFEPGLQKHLGQHISTGSRVSSYHSAQLTPKEAELADTMACYVKWLEGVVRQHPSQWAWDYKKWSRKPKESQA